VKTFPVEKANKTVEFSPRNEHGQIAHANFLKYLKIYQLSKSISRIISFTKMPQLTLSMFWLNFFTRALKNSH
jgi:hypothetical protein